MIAQLVGTSMVPRRRLWQSDSMTLLAYTDILLRGASLGILALLLVRLLLRKPVGFLEFSFAALTVSLIIYLLVSAPATFATVSEISAVLKYIPVATPFLFWWAGMAFFNDDFGPKLWHAVLATSVTVPVLAIGLLPGAEYVRTFVIIGLYSHLVYVALSTGPSDLVEERRQFRRWFIVFAVFFGVTIELAEISRADHSLPQSVYPLQAAGLFILISAFAFWSLKMSGPFWQARRARSVLSKDARNPIESHLLEKLLAEMEAGVWREEGLTVGKLAEKLKAPEHQVRRAINGGLGYRNFSNFVNERRIDEACRRLSDPADAAKPILSLAYDVGFASIGPFNRAFRQIKGQSPSEYKKQAHGRPAGNRTGR